MIENSLLDSANVRMRKYLDMLGNTSDNFIPMSMGYPEPGEFPLSANVLEALSVVHDGKEKPRPAYGWPSGASELKDSLLTLENELHGTNYTNDCICLVAGATYGFNRICEHIFINQNNFGKKILIVAPTYFWMHNRLKYYAEVKTVVGKEKNNFQITVDEVLNALDDETKAIFIANPSNPTYLYYEDKFFEKLVPELEARKIYLIIDESGDAFYSDRKNYRLKSFSSVLENPFVIRIVTASKKYLLAEYRIGYVLASKDFIGDKTFGFAKTIGDDIGNVPLATNEAMLKIAQLELLMKHGNSTEEVIEYQRTMYSNNQKMLSLRNICISSLKSVDSVDSIIMPDGNFNITFRVGNTKYTDDVSLAIDMIKNADICVVPCSAFGIEASKLYFRMTYGLKEDKLLEGTARLVKFLKSIEETGADKKLD
jgi:aspartate/methionine/tyrosine aminotransferase